MRIRDRSPNQVRYGTRQGERKSDNAKSHPRQTYTVTRIQDVKWHCHPSHGRYCSRDKVSRKCTIILQQLWHFLELLPKRDSTTNSRWLGFPHSKQRNQSHRCQHKRQDKGERVPRDRGLFPNQIGTSKVGNPRRCYSRKKIPQSG